MALFVRDVLQLKSGKKLIIKPLDACKLFIDTTGIAFINMEKNADQEITAISFEDQEKISIGDQIMIKIGEVHSMYNVSMIIVDKKQTSVVIFSSLPNKTSTFLLPLLNKSKFQLKYDSYFVNAYISNCHTYLCLVYRYTGTNLYKQFEESMIQDKLCVKHIDYDKYHVMYLFKIPSEFKGDIEHFLEGKYSKFSNTLKKLILKFYNGEKQNMVYQIVSKSPNLKQLIEKDLNVKLDNDAELHSKPTLEQELYTIINK